MSEVNVGLREWELYVEGRIERQRRRFAARNGRGFSMYEAQELLTFLRNHERASVALDSLLAKGVVELYRTTDGRRNGLGVRFVD